jgi:hypothetical protein
VRSAATVILVIGLSFGVLGAVAGIGLHFFGKTVATVVMNIAGKEAGATLTPADRHQLGIEPSTLSAVSVLARLPVVLLGGLLGLLGNAAGASRMRARTCGALAAAAGVVLLVYQGWISAGAFVIGGALVFTPTVLPRQ